MKTYVHLVDGIPYEWNLQFSAVKSKFPNILVEEYSDLSEYGFEPLVQTAQPSYDQQTQDVIEIHPVKINGFWTQQWSIFELDTASLEATKLKFAEEFQASCLVKVQERLDEFAKTRNYDGILSACSYVGSKIPKFSTEGQYCADMRDSTWAAMYTLYYEIQIGIKTMPTSFEEVAAILPELVWP